LFNISVLKVIEKLNYARRDIKMGFLDAGSTLAISTKINPKINRRNKLINIKILLT